MFVAKPQIKTSIPYLQKSVHKMTISDMADMADKASRFFQPRGENVQIGVGIPQQIVYNGDLSDMFTINGKLNKRTKFKFFIAMMDGRLPKKATIQDFYFTILNHIAESIQTKRV